MERDQEALGGRLAREFSRRTPNGVPGWAGMFFVVARGRVR